MGRGSLTNQTDLDMPDDKDTSYTEKSLQSELQNFDISGLLTDILQYITNIRNCAENSDDIEMMREDLLIETEYILNQIENHGINIIDSPINGTCNDEDILEIVGTEPTGHISDDKTVCELISIGCTSDYNFIDPIPEKIKIFRYDKKLNMDRTRCSIFFDENGGTGKMKTASTLAEEEFELPVCTFEPPLYKEFAGWSENPNGELIDGRITVPDSEILTLYAIWDSTKDVLKIEHKINGLVIESSERTVTLGEHVLVQPIFIKGYVPVKKQMEATMKPGLTLTFDYVPQETTIDCEKPLEYNNGIVYLKNKLGNYENVITFGDIDNLHDIKIRSNLERSSEKYKLCLNIEFINESTNSRNFDSEFNKIAKTEARSFRPYLDIRFEMKVHINSLEYVLFQYCNMIEFDPLTKKTVLYAEYLQPKNKDDGEN